MEKQTVRPAHIRRRHILARLLLSAAAVVILLPVVLTALYSFFSPGEIKAFMQTRGSFDAKSLMEIKLSPNMFSLSQYYKILIEDMTILRYFVNSAMYTAAILFGQALLIPAMAYALSRFRFRGRDALFFVVIMFATGKVETFKKLKLTPAIALGGLMIGMSLACYVTSSSC